MMQFRAPSRWLTVALLLVSLSAFVYSLQVRQHDWQGVTAEAPY